MNHSESIQRYCEALSAEQLHRLYRQLHDRVYHRFAGGLVFGVDWSTLHVCHPGLGLALDVIRRSQSSRVTPPPPIY